MASPNVAVPGLPPARSAEPGGHDTHLEPTPGQADPAAAAAATRFATAWARPGLPAHTWWAEITALCEPGFAEQLRTVDPGRIPTDRITGPPVVRSSYTTSATFTFTTPAGQLSVTVIAVGGAWLASANDFTRGAQ